MRRRIRISWAPAIDRLPHQGLTGCVSLPLQKKPVWCLIWIQLFRWEYHLPTLWAHSGPPQPSGPAPGKAELVLNFSTWISNHSKLSTMLGVFMGFSAWPIFSSNALRCFGPDIIQVIGFLLQKSSYWSLCDPTPEEWRGSWPVLHVSREVS